MRIKMSRNCKKREISTLISEKVENDSENYQISIF